MPMMQTSSCPSPLGLIRITASDTGLHSVLFTDNTDQQEVPVYTPSCNHIIATTIQQLREYFHEGRRLFDIPLDPAGTLFQQQVWQELVKIPFGKTSTYSAIARQLSNPLSVRAVGTANGKNPIAIIVPCHRVIGADGSLTGYAGGLWRKAYLLQLEGSGKYSQPTLW
jgi:methylated-DNA-[protein]-cysteine S-methyltransferase